ncbi:Hypothetical predicted protein [Marmota monax]|uniref:Uncharacterized protein n=1 Tax=Marmota monax TaxID=9995 RepID=A0A5E4C220_MARMO|nr:hypothetical protein GHT09_019982 [Marmota monax]VTJ74952.1 Hypothetical predicted protein [Marmota monax]
MPSQPLHIVLKSLKREGKEPLVLKGRRGAHAPSARVEPAGGGHPRPHHPPPQHLDVPVAAQDWRLPVHHPGPRGQREL